MSQGFFKVDGTPVKGFVCYTEDGQNVTVIGQYYYERKDGCRIPIVDGDTSDGLSYPKVFWNIAPPTGEGWPGGLTHDRGYRHGFPKDFMDETLLEILEFLNVPEWRAKITYEGVALGGEGSYEEDVAAWRKKNGF
jgi:hypothetical protein